MRGRKPKPEAVKAQVAPVRSRRTAKAAEAVPAVSVGGVAPPASVKGEALKLWNALAPTLLNAKLLSPPDVPAFARYCRLAARWEQAEKTLDKEGLTYESESAHGKLKRAHPAAMLSMRYSRELMALETQFGLLPAERQRIMASRAQTGVTGDLFAAPKVEAPSAAEAKPAEIAPRPKSSPIALLN
jgi:P27 family predicted phage terminase small subunit